MSNRWAAQADSYSTQPVEDTTITGMTHPPHGDDAGASLVAGEGGAALASFI